MMRLFLNKSQNKSHNIIFTGGGSGGHVVPALTLINDLKKNQFHIHYIGSYSGIERELTKHNVNQYYPIHTGKLRRYIDAENIKDLFRIVFGFIQALLILFKLRKNTLVVSMGGFVSVPVVLAAKVLFIPIVVHEQTTRVGLANKIASKFADKVLVSFEDSLQYFPKNKTVLTGYPVRDEFLSDKLSSNIVLGVNLLELNKRIIFVTGGGNGAKLLNDKVKEIIPKLSKNYFVFHQVGKQFFDEFEPLKSDSYLPLSFIGNEMPDIFKCADIVISRSGAGTVAELMALGKKSIFIPLKIAQKNEQYHNAMAAHKALGSVVVEEDQFRNLNLYQTIESFEGHKTKITGITNPKKNILAIINSYYS